MAFINTPDLRTLQDAVMRADAALRGDSDREAARLALVKATAILATVSDGIADPGLREEANAKYGTDDIEIDDEPATSAGDQGTWVAAWVWIEEPEGDEE
ncbi:hypothetical protein [Novosphingobium sp. KN65.2]|uniref:hypothetical protein n=1 Tax=Novosphingobium sp. KN65.2 TaxID=1478134 RepID=UPI0005DBF740|nr:hypothetical protein [Novosphingobium sp. KN65.2]CDO34020.1 hypothetical protein SPHV1_100054 [Novosphingobium sp. KN65.2]